MNLYIYTYTGKYCYGGLAIVAVDPTNARWHIEQYLKTPQGSGARLDEFVLSHTVRIVKAGAPPAGVLWANWECC